MNISIIKKTLHINGLPYELGSLLLDFYEKKEAILKYPMIKYDIYGLLKSIIMAETDETTLQKNVDLLHKIGDLFGEIHPYFIFYKDEIESQIKLGLEQREQIFLVQKIKAELYEIKRDYKPNLDVEQITDMIPKNEFSYKNLSKYNSNINCFFDAVDKIVTEYFKLDYPTEMNSSEDQLKLFLEEYEKDIGKFTVENVEKECVDGQLKETLSPSSLKDILYFELFHVAQNQVRFRKCKYCGKYFILTHNGAVSCTRIVEGTEKTCRELGSNKLHTKQAQQEPELKLYYREYKRRYNYCLSRKLSKEPFFIWAKEARIMRDKCINKEISLKTFENWLKIE